MNSLNIISNVILILAIMVLLYSMYTSFRKRYLRAKLIRTIITTYTSIQFFNRGEIKHMRGIVESSKSFIPDYIYGSATKLLDMREEVLNDREKGSSK